MGSILDWNEILAVPDALRCARYEARTALVRTAMEGGRIAKAAKRVAQLCLSHFEHEAQSRGFAELAHNLRNRKWVEDEVIYPALVLIGG